MYIPSSFFSSQGACISSSVTYVTGSGSITSGSFVSASITWSYIQFEMTDSEDASLTSFTASLNILSGSTGQAKVLIVGGGGTSAAVGGIDDGSIRTWDVPQAGGGGAGGVVYYNNFPLSVGTYEIGVGSATSGNQLCSFTNTGALCGKVGKTSYIKLPNNSVYTPFSSSFLTAYGGGGGSPQGWFYLVSPFRPFYKNFYIDGAVFASAGGASGCEGPGSSPGNSSNTVAGGAGLGGLNGANQGQNGGAWQGGDPGNGYTNGGGPGGGGIGSAGANLGSGTGNFAKVTNGGDGLTYNLTGTNILVSNGGGGYNSINPAATGQRGSSNASTYGSGGNGNGGTGNGGLVIIAWPVCLYPTPPRPIPPISGSFPVSASVIYDFGNIISYPTTGSIVYDLSGNNNHGNLTGLTLPAYSASNGCIIRLDSSQLQNVDYSASFTPNDTVVTIWKNFNSTFLVDSGIPDASMAYGIKATTIGGTKQYTPILYDNVGNGNTYFSATLTPADITIWHQYATIASSSGTNSTATTYLDGSGSSATQTKSFNRSGSAGSGSVFVGKDRAVAGRYSNGYLMGYLQYNRVLTTVELDQIYTTFSTRF